MLDSSKLKVFTDDNIIVTQNFKFALRTVENIVGKGKNAGNQKDLQSNFPLLKPQEVREL